MIDKVCDKIIKKYSVGSGQSAVRSTVGNQQWAVGDNPKEEE
jgi:hypothetical protein